jgi:1-acyl-sn-glycerol-3-phosphate acyltransferase
MKSLKRFVVGVYDCVVFYLGVSGFGLVCLTWTLFAVILHPVMPINPGRRLGRFVIMLCFRGLLGFLQLSGRFKFDLRSLDALRQQGGLIIAPNHPSFWDVVLVVSRLPDVACIMKASIINNIFLGAGARLARYIRNESARKMILRAVGELQQGNSILLFPEGTRTVRYPVNPFTGSIGVIARRSDAPVQTVFIETDSPFLTKGWPVYKKPELPISYRVRLGQRFEATADRVNLMAELEQYFADEIVSARGHDAPAAVTPTAGIEHPVEACPVSHPN